MIEELDPKQYAKDLEDYIFKNVYPSMENLTAVIAVHISILTYMSGNLIALANFDELAALNFAKDMSDRIKSAILDEYLNSPMGKDDEMDTTKR